MGVRVKIWFKDGHCFEGNETWFTGGRKYRFHLMDARGRLLWRLDNAPHHREIGGGPDHRHLPDGAVEGALPITLDRVLLSLRHRGRKPPNGARHGGADGDRVR